MFASLLTLLKALATRARPFIVAARHDRRKAAILATIIVALVFMVVPRQPRSLQPQRPQYPPAQQQPQQPPVQQPPDVPVPVPVLHGIDLTLFPEPPGLSTDNMSITHIPQSGRAESWALHVADPTQPATLTLTWQPPRPISVIDLTLSLALLDDPRVFSPRRRPTADIQATVTVLSGGQVIQPSRAMLRTATQARSTINLPAPSEEDALQIVITFPPRFLSLVVTITELHITAD